MALLNTFGGNLAACCPQQRDFDVQKHRDLHTNQY